MAKFSVQHTQIKGDRPYWYQLGSYSDRDKAMHRARNYALDHGDTQYAGLPSETWVTDASGLVDTNTATGEMRA